MAAQAAVGPNGSVTRMPSQLLSPEPAPEWIGDSDAITASESRLGGLPGAAGVVRQPTGTDISSSSWLMPSTTGFMRMSVDHPGGPGTDPGTGEETVTDAKNFQ